jgi:hypothetical protein
MRPLLQVLGLFAFLVIMAADRSVQAADGAPPTQQPLHEAGLADSLPSQSNVAAPALLQPFDAGPIMLRCAGTDGVFSFDQESDDLVAWATPLEPIDLAKPSGVPYHFGVIPPLGAHCRIFRAPFPVGVEPPPSPDPPDP